MVLRITTSVSGGQAVAGDVAANTAITETESAENSLPVAGKPTRTRAQKSAFNSRPGRRDMKEYPLTQPELIGLGGVSLAATVFFSVASWCGTNWFDIKKDVALASGIKPETIGYWQGLETAFGYAALGFAGLGVIFLVLNGLSLLAIIRNTRHD